MKLVQVNFAFDANIASPGALLDSYRTLTGWSDAAVSAGLSVSVVQAYTRDDQVHRSGVDYLFRASTPTRALTGEGLHAAVLSCGPDVVHVNGLDSPVQTWWLRRALPPHVALVVQDHAGAPTHPLSPKAPIRRRAMQAADAYLFTSREQATPWLDAGFIGDPALVHEVLEASTSIAPIDSDAARQHTGISGTPAVLWVGRLNANKDPICVLAGFEAALTSMRDATLTMIYEDAPLLAAVRERVAASAELRRRVRLVGAVPHEQLGSWYSAADLFVLGSHHEGSGYALLEACACGVLPVVSDIPAFRTITADGEFGLHWRCGDPMDLAAALAAAASREHRRDRRAVLNHFGRELSWAAVGRRARVIYEQVVEARRRRESAESAC